MNFRFYFVFCRTPVLSFLTGFLMHILVYDNRDVEAAIGITEGSQRLSQCY